IITSLGRMVGEAGLVGAFSLTEPADVVPAVRLTGLAQFGVGALEIRLSGTGIRRSHTEGQRRKDSQRQNGQQAFHRRGPSCWVGAPSRAAPQVPQVRLVSPNRPAA